MKELSRRIIFIRLGGNDPLDDGGKTTETESFFDAVCMGSIVLPL